MSILNISVSAFIFYESAFNVKEPSELDFPERKLALLKTKVVRILSPYRSTAAMESYFIKPTLSSLF